MVTAPGCHRRSTLTRLGTDDYVTCKIDNVTTEDQSGGRPARSALLVANTGGHLRELHELRPRFDVEHVEWMTFDDEQSRSLLSQERVHQLRWTGSRDYGNTDRNMGHALSHLRRRRYDAVISTGAAVALSVLPVARALGMQCHYVESATRTHHPSVTGRLLAAVPGVHLYSQYNTSTSRRWSYAGSVFDGFAPIPPRAVSLRRVVVALGTMRQWSFRTAVERLLLVLPPGVEVTWQTGHTDVSGLNIDARPLLPSADLSRLMSEADLVVAHAGVGSSLDALSAGHRPLLLPRRASRREHVDDHQAAVAAELVRRGLAVAAEAPNITLQDMLDAAGRRVERTTSRPFTLLGPNRTGSTES